jgi:teichoic acid ribitol-phosphate primase
MSPWRNRLRAALVRGGYSVGRLLPTRRRVVLATAHADSISGNLEWLRRGLERLEPAVPVDVVASRARPGLRGILAGIGLSLRAGWHLATARVVILDDYFFPRYVVPRRAGTTTIQVWHACGAFKRFGYSLGDAEFGSASASAGGLRVHTNYDLCLVSAERFAPFYAEAFDQPIERFTSRLGIPRTDLFFDEAAKARTVAAIHAAFPQLAGRQVVLYAPTFRGARTTEARTPTELDLIALDAALGRTHVVLLREHPFARALRRDRREALPPSVVDASDWPEINELMLVSDVLVTDYSSAIYEFALLGRPIAFFAPDQADYVRERGFYLDWPADLPGPVFETTPALIEHLSAASFDLERVRRFAAASFDVADGGATERLVTEVVRPALR